MNENFIIKQICPWQVFLPFDVKIIEITLTSPSEIRVKVSYLQKNSQGPNLMESKFWQLEIVHMLYCADVRTYAVMWLLVIHYFMDYWSWYKSRSIFYFVVKTKSNYDIRVLRIFRFSTGHVFHDRGPPIFFQCLNDKKFRPLRIFRLSFNISEIKSFHLFIYF